jgi:hypothetical protein
MSAWQTYLRPFLLAKDRKPIKQIAKESLKYKEYFNQRPKDYFFLALYMKYIDEDVTDYIPNAFVYHFNIVMNGELRPPVVEDKSQTSALLRSENIRTVQEFMAFDPAVGFVASAGQPYSIDQACAAIAHRGRAFAKPLSANMGRGARIVSAQPADLQTIVQARQHMIFQPVVEQHEVLARLNPSSVNTIRINTLRTDDHVDSHVAVMRVGRAGAIVDNAAAGGLCVRIDMRTGQLARFARAKPSVSTRLFEQHPDTGVAFGSVHVPFWPDVLELVQQGARAMAPLRSLGWDVAVTPEGPIVIETNAAWAPEVFQLCQPLGPTGLAEPILALQPHARHRVAVHA